MTSSELCLDGSNPSEQQDPDDAFVRVHVLIKRPSSTQGVFEPAPHMEGAKVWAQGRRSRCMATGPVDQASRVLVCSLSDSPALPEKATDHSLSGRTVLDPRQLE